MIHPSLKKEILSHLDSLPYDLQQKVLEFIRSLSSKLPTGVSGKDLLRFAGKISKEDIKKMNESIEKGCERVDLSEW